MTVISWDDFIKQGLPEKKPLSATIGVFDGVHTGHRKLINHVMQQKDGSLPTIFTFTVNPSAIFFPDTFLGHISTVDQKMDMFRSLGVKLVVLIDFSLEFSKLSGKEFFDLICGQADLNAVGIGKNFHCGKDNDTNAEKVKELLEKRGTRVTIFKPTQYRGERVSSTRIRQAILNRDLKSVQKMLTRPYRAVVTGFDHLQEKHEIHTDQIIPGDGVYKTRLIMDDMSTLPCVTGVQKRHVFIQNCVYNKQDIKIIEFLKEVNKEKGD